MHLLIVCKMNVIKLVLLLDPSIGPNVEAALSTSPSQALSQAEQRKAIIGSKKPAAAKKGVIVRDCLRT